MGISSHYILSKSEPDDPFNNGSLSDNSSWVISLSDLMSLLLIFFLVWTTVKIHRLQEQLDSENYTSPKEVRLRNITHLKGMLFRFNPVETTDGSVLMVLDNEITFDSGSDRLSGDGKRMLYSIAKALKGSTHYRLKVLGHCDKVSLSSNSRYSSNMELSFQRAVAVANELVEQGVDPEKVWVQGLGDLYPLKDNGVLLDNKFNRRVELIIEPTT